VNFLVPTVYSKPDVMITDENGLETVNNILIPNKQYSISIRDEPWDDKYEIHHMTYNAMSNNWKKSKRKLKKSFEIKLVDQDRAIPTVSVIQVVKKTNKIEIAYSSALFSLSNHVDLNKLCQNWIKDQKKTKLTNNIPCHCNLKEAENDPNYEYDIMCTSQEINQFWVSENCKTNKGAYQCVMSKSTMYVYSKCS